MTYSCAFCEDNDVLVDPRGTPPDLHRGLRGLLPAQLITLAFGDDGTVRLDAAQEYEA